MSVRCQTYAWHLTLTASWPPTRSGELFNCKHPDYRPVYAERAVRLARIRAPYGSCQPCAPNCLALQFTTGSSGSTAGKAGVTFADRTTTVIPGGGYTACPEAFARKRPVGVGSAHRLIMQEPN